ncbi:MULTISPECIES: hypothetical protein [unclassified Streptomyces]|uniref:hypothetical protein n=1 Tax=unclassified Streptomyces TaxID=2593676 RepID=UPI000F6BE158|nr:MULTISPECIES: hypothetical protein [unclassified Streptomyces]AZM62242.1 hypothetical protein DLM49_24350 [Streptomyces sp. WAC 01438]RSM96262.1 hypothetical protein DMA10_13970 [Streptomyces sp. WAC 01420]UUG66811.1 Ktm31 [Streptomyces sp.]
MQLALDLDTVMTVMLVRFALVVAAVSVLLIIGFAIVITLKRNGRIDGVSKHVGPVARALSQSRALNTDRYGRPPGLRRRALLSVLDHLGREGNRK